MTKLMPLQVGCWCLMFRLLSWNVRGINDRNKKVLLKSFLRYLKCDLVCLQETKKVVVSSSNIRSFWGYHSVDFAALNAVGSSGGVLVMWDKSVYHIVSSFVVTSRSLAFFKRSRVVSLGLSPRYMALKLGLIN